jgi:hypothetical protein
LETLSIGDAIDDCDEDRYKHTDDSFKDIHKLSATSLTNFDINGCHDITDVSLQWLAKAMKGCLGSVTTMAIGYCWDLTADGIVPFVKASNIRQLHITDPDGDWDGATTGELARKALVEHGIDLTVYNPHRGLSQRFASFD